MSPRVNYIIQRFVWLCMAMACVVVVQGQMVPSRGENISHLVTFGNEAPTRYGDDDYCQVFFFVVPKTHSSPIYIRIFDPDVGGAEDQANGEFNTVTKFSVYGGPGTYSNPDARGLDPIGNYDSGTLLAAEKFKEDPERDGKWFSLGPFNPAEGEWTPDLNGYVFKIICQGIKGNDANLYKYFLSQAFNQNIPVEGGNGFTYEYSFRLPAQEGAIAHLYPYVDQNVVAIKQNNFDFDQDGFIKIFSIARNGHHTAVSGENEWSNGRHEILELEKGKSLDIQIIRQGNWGNDMVFYVSNQFDEPMPFYAIPLGGVPKYQYDIQVTVTRKPSGK